MCVRALLVVDLDDLHLANSEKANFFQCGRSHSVDFALAIFQELYVCAFIG